MAGDDFDHEGGDGVLQFDRFADLAGGDRVGLVVDQIIGDHQTVIKSLSKLHADVTTFSGATILGEGRVVLILDVAALVRAGTDAQREMQHQN